MRAPKTTYLINAVIGGRLQAGDPGTLAEIARTHGVNFRDETRGNSASRLTISHILANRPLTLCFRSADKAGTHPLDAWCEERGLRLCRWLAGTTPPAGVTAGDDFPASATRGKRGTRGKVTTIQPVPALTFQP